MMGRMDHLPAQVLVMPDHGDVDLLPVWSRGSAVGGALDQTELAISDQLTARLRAWNDAWADRHPEKSRRWAGLNRQEWLETGYRLARQLQAELPDVQVLVLDAKDREVPVLDIPNGQ
jgi:hypothetical protein